MRDYVSDPIERSAKNWWIPLLVGVLSLTLGIVFLFRPLDAWASLVSLFVAGFFVMGIAQIVFAVSNRRWLIGWGWTLTGGILTVLLGGLLLNIPYTTPSLMIYFVGFWLLFQSIWGIGVAVDFYQAEVKGWGWLLALTILGALFSFILLLAPVFAPKFIVAMAVSSFTAYGVFGVYLGIQLKSLKNELEQYD